MGRSHPLLAFIHSPKHGANYNQSLKTNNVQSIKVRALQAFGGCDATTRIWDFYIKEPYALLEGDALSAMLEDEDIEDNNDIFLEHTDRPFQLVQQRKSVEVQPVPNAN